MIQRGQKKSYAAAIRQRRAKKESKFKIALKKAASRTGDFLCRNAGTFVGVAIASALLTAVVGAVAFSVVILPDNNQRVPDNMYCSNCVDIHAQGIHNRYDIENT